MKKKILMFIAFSIAIVTLAGCFSFEGVENLTINTQLKEKYNVDEVFVLDGIIVTANMTGGSTQSLAFNDVRVSKISGHRLVDGSFRLDTSQVGKFTLKISFEGVIFEVDYEVVEAGSWDGVSVTPIDINPDNKTYEVDTPSKLAWIAQQSATNNFDGKIIKITADINMGNQTWPKIQYLYNATIIGEKEGGVKPTISGLTSGLISTASNIKVSNLIFDFNIDTIDGFSGLVRNLVPKHEGYSLNRTTEFNEVEIKGKVIACLSSSSFVGYGQLYPHYGKEDIKFIKCSSTLELTVLNTVNTGNLIGHANYHDLYIDSHTLNHTTGKLIVQSGDSTAGFYIGYGGEENVFIDNNEPITKKSFSSTYNNYNATENPYLEYIVPNTKTFSTSMIGTYVTVDREPNATKVVATLSYIVGSGYGRYITKSLSFSTTDSTNVLVPLKFQYVSQNPESINWLNYIYNDEYDKVDGAGNRYALRAPNKDYIFVTVTQMNADGEIVKTELYTYINVQNRPN